MMKDLHLIIKRYRLIYISFSIFICFFLWNMWAWYKSNHAAVEDYGAAGVFGVMFLAMVPVVREVIKGFREDSQHD